MASTMIMPPPSTPFLSLPLEITQQTIILVPEIKDVCALSKTCRRFRNIIYSPPPSDSYIWKNLFLGTFDDPRDASIVYDLLDGARVGFGNRLRSNSLSGGFNWMKELQRRIRAGNKHIRANRIDTTTFGHHDPSTTLSESERREILETFISVLQTAAPASSSSSKNMTWLLEVLETSNSLNHALASPQFVFARSLQSYNMQAHSFEGPEIEQLKSQLHTYFGLTYCDRHANTATTTSFDYGSPVSRLTIANHHDFLHEDPDWGVEQGLYDVYRSHIGATGSLLRHFRNHSDNYPQTRAFWANRKRSLRALARGFVYDLRNYREDTNWGPLLPIPTSTSSGGPLRRRPIHRINWKHMESIMIVVAWNMSDGINGPWHNILALSPSLPLLPPMGMEKTRSLGAPGMRISELKKQNTTPEEDEDPELRTGVLDWAGVEGKWKRIVCFCDYHDLMIFNATSRETGAPRDVSMFEDEDFAEAVRCLTLDLKIVSSSPSTFIEASSDLPSDTHPEKIVRTRHARPTLFFEGLSEGGSNNEAQVRGSVEEVIVPPDPKTGLAGESYILWKFVSVHDGIERWSSKGIQLGGVGSSAGVLGCWTGVDHEEGDPAGPTWMWKVEPM